MIGRLNPRLIAAMLVLAAPAPLAHAQSAPASAIDPARLALGIDLARITNGDEVSHAQLNKMMSETMPNALKSNPDVVAMEKQYPGIITAMLDGMRPLFEKYMNSEMEKLLPVIGRIYAEKMSVADLQATIAFYRSPLGKHVLEMMGEESDFSAALSEAIADPDNKVSESGLRAGLYAGVMGVRARLTPAETAEIGRFEASSAGLSLRTTIAPVQAAVVASSNGPTPELDAALQKVVLDVIEKYTGKRPTL